MVTKQYIKELNTIFKKDYEGIFKIQKNGEFICTLNDIVKIPSLAYPLKYKETMEVFLHENTENFTSNEAIKLKDVYDSFKFVDGICYMNMENLDKALKLYNIKNYKIYTGWILLSSSLPLHHCWIVYDGNKVLDPSNTSYNLDFENKTMKLNSLGNSLSPEKAKEELNNLKLKYINEKNSSYQTFGKVFENAIYVGTETTPNQGRLIFRDILSKINNHPSYS